MKTLRLLLALALASTLNAQNVTLQKTPATPSGTGANNLTAASKVIVVPDGGSITATGTGVIAATSIPGVTINTTAPLAGGGSLATNLTLSIPAATGSVNGYLRSSDWTAFNGKESVLSFSAPLSRTSNAVSIPGATSLTDGYLKAADWSTFNGKENVLTFSAPLARTLNAIALPAASASVNGYLSSTDWSTFNGKQSSLTLGNLTEATSAVLTITGGTSAVVGSGAALQVKQAGTAQAGYLSSSDWNIFNGKQAAGAYVTALTGDVTASGPGSAAATLATVATAGTTGSSTAIPVITIDAKGRATGITTAAVVAPAVTLTGTTLASNVVTSSLTSVGTLANLTVTNPIAGSVTGNAGTVTTNANLTGPITSTGNATAIASQTGTGTKFVVDNSPTLITPVLGVAAATSVNKVAITAPATAATLTIADGKSLTVSNNATVSGTNTGDQTIALTGDVTGSGTGTFAATLATVNSNVGTFGNNTSAVTATVNGKGLITAISQSTITPAYGSVIGFPTGNLAGRTSATTGALESIAPGSSLTLTSGTVDTVQDIRTSASPTFTSVTANLTGNVTGNATGNAGTATALQTGRTINGVSFNGTANITVPAAAGTLTGATLASNVTASSLTSFGSSPAVRTNIGVGLGVTNGYFIGDSITNGAAASPNSNGYPWLISANYGVSDGNISWGGANIAAYNRFVYPGFTNPNTGSISTAVNSPAAITTSDLIHIWGDYNGLRDFGNVLAYQQHTEMAFRSAVMYSAIPNTAKITGQSASATKSGAWSNLSNYGGAMGVYSSTVNDTVTFTVAGNSVYLAMLNYSAPGTPFVNGVSGQPTTTGSTFEVFIDSISQGVFKNYLAYGNRYAYSGSSAYETEIIDYCGWGYRFPGLGDGTHTVIVKVISGLSARPVSFLWGSGSGSFAANDQAGPLVVLENTMRPIVAGGGSLTTEALINSAIAAFHNPQARIVADAQADGLRVLLADTTPFYSTSNVSGDNVHPTTAGHLQLAQATYAALSLQPAPANRKTSWATTVYGPPVGVTYSLVGTTGRQSPDYQKVVIDQSGTAGFDAFLRDVVEQVPGVSSGSGSSYLFRETFNGDFRFGFRKDGAIIVQTTSGSGGANATFGSNSTSESSIAFNYGTALDRTLSLAGNSIQGLIHTTSGPANISIQTGGGNLVIGNSASIVTLDGTTDSTTTGTGSLVVGGGGGFGGSLNIGGHIYATSASSSQSRFQGNTSSKEAIYLSYGGSTDRRLSLTANAIQVYLNSDGATAANLALQTLGGNVNFGTSGSTFTNNGNSTIAGTLTVGGGTAISKIRRTTATLIAGTVTVTDAAITANSEIYVGMKTPGGTPGACYVSAKTTSTNYVITSTSALDTSVVSVLIIEP